MDHESDARREQRILPAIHPTGRHGASRMLERLRFSRGILLYLLICAFVYAEVAGTTAGGPYHRAASRLVLCIAGALGVYLLHRRSHRAPVGGRKLAPDDDESEEPHGEPKVVNWPMCPHCRRPRQTSCPICQTAGNQFPEAFLPDREPAASEDANESARLYVLCPTCDEPFAPEFLARCEWCGHQFRDGRETPPPSPLTSPFEDVNPRVWILVAGLVAVFVLTLAMLSHIVPKE